MCFSSRLSEPAEAREEPAKNHCRAGSEPDLLEGFVSFELRPACLSRVEESLRKWMSIVHTVHCTLAGGCLSARQETAATELDAFSFVPPKLILSGLVKTTNYGCSHSRTALHVKPPPSAPFYTGLKAPRSCALPQIHPAPQQWVIFDPPPSSLA